MATLRDGIFGNPDAPVSQGFKDRLSTSGMGSLQRGWESGRIGNELNPLYTEELEAGIANDEPRRSALRTQIDALKQKQSMYAPEVSDLRQINGVGDAADWVAGQVGQGTASMIDPVAVSAGLGVVGRVASAIPHPVARAVGGAAQIGQFAVPALMSKRQLTGEFIGEAEQDPELMARTSKQGLRDMAGNYGTIAAIPDSALPGIVGRQVSGLSRAGGAVARKAAVGPALTTLGNMGVEGLTEGAQAAGSQYARGVLNPDRDTSGDTWDVINNAAGGAVGAGPFAGAGAYAEAGHNRVGAGVDAVKGAVGDVVDMANTNPTVQAGVAKAKSIAERVRGSTVDMMSDEEGKVSAAALIDNLKAGAQDLKSKPQTALEEHNILAGMPPADIIDDNDKTLAWMKENDAKRGQLIADKLQAMPDDPEAQKHLEALSAPDDAAYLAAVEGAAQFIMSKTPLGRTEERMNSLGENLGKIAGVVAPAIGRGAVAAGKAALGFGKAVLGGAKDGMRKKNEQTNESPAEESFGQWRDRNYGVKGVEAADAALAEGASYKKAMDFNQRAELAGSYAEDMAKRGTLKNKNAGLFAKHIAFGIADMVDTDLSKGGVEAKAVKLNRLTTDFHELYGKNAAEVITQMGSILGKGASPVVAHMMEQLQMQQSAQGRAALVTERDMLAKQVVGLVDPTMQNVLMKQGVNLNTPGGRDQVLRIMEDFADKISSDPQARKALDQTLGEESVQNILTLLNGVQEEKKSPYGTSSQFESQEIKDGEKLAAKGSGPKVYGFHKAPNLRTHSERRDMFGAMDAPDSEGVAQRPQLFKRGEKLFGGRDAIEKKIEDVKAQLAGDPEYPDHDNHSVTAKSAHEVMKEAGMQPGKVLQLYRDYMRMEAKDDKLSEGQRKYATQQARIAHGTILDATQKKDADGKLQSYTFKVGPKDRAEIKQAAEAYFKERYVVVGEQLSNRDPSQISLPEMLDMNKEGMGLIERSRLTEEPKQTLADANVLMFKSDAVKGGEVAIPAGKLVNWVRKMRGSTEQSSAEDNDQSYSNKSKDDEFRNDVMEGIASLIGSGHVKGMPYKLNKFGSVESFAKGIPDSLRLATKTEGAIKFGDAKRREKYLTDLPEADPTKREALRARLESAKGAYADIVKGGASKEEVEAARHAVGAAKTALDEYADANSGEYESAVTKEQTRERSDETEGSIDDTVDDAPMSKREIRNALTRAEKVELNSKATHEERVAYIKSITKGMGIADAAEFLRDLELTNANGAAFNPDAKTSKTGDRSKTPLDFFPKAEGVPDEFANQRWLSKQTGATTDASIGPEPKGTAASSAKFRAQKIGEAFLRDSAEGMDMIKMRIRSAMRPVYSADKTAVVGGVHYIAPVAAFINAEELAKANVDLPAKTIKAIQSKVANILLKGDVSKTEKVKIARLMLDGQEKITAQNVDAVLGRYAEGVATGKPVVAKQETSAPEVANAGLPKGQATLSGGSEGRKLNAMAADIHRSLGRDGFAATHDSPHKHEGKFDWRAHQGKGEGNASFGAGTYLSTSDGVHQSYKRDFTAMANEADPRESLLEFRVQNIKDNGDLLDLTDDQIRANRRDLDKAREELAAYRKTQPKSPTYEVSVDIKPEELLDWDKPLSEQSEAVQEALYTLWGDKEIDTGNLDDFHRGGATGAQIYRMLERELGSQRDASDALQEHGILGHKYAASGGKNDTHPNYVVYDDSRITTNYVHFNNQDAREGNSKVSTQAERDAAVAEAKKLFGDQVKVDFQDITGYSGEFIDATNVIVISTTAAAGTMNTLFHEAMHKFFKDFVKSNPKLQAVFESLINDPKHLQKLHDLLDGYPAAQAQLTSGEERLAYTYQFWKAGLLQVDTKAHTWLQKVGKFFRHVLGRVRDSERALELFQAFDNGKMSEPSAAGMVIAQALGRGGNAMKVRRQVDALVQGLAALTVPAAEILGNSLSPTARALSPMLFTNPGDEAHGSKEIGMMNARRNVAQQYTNVSNRRFETMSEVDKAAVQKYLQSGADPATIPSKEQRDAVKDIRNLLDRFHKYMTDSGMDIGKIDNYYPVVWNPNLLNSNKSEFINMLVTKYAGKMGTGSPQKAAERIWQSLVNKEGVDAHLPVGREDGVLSPFFASQEQRTLPWLEAADREKYLDKNMPLTLTRYFSQGAHATEYFRRFGKNGIKLERMLNQINVELSGVSKEMMKRGEIKDEGARVKWVGRQMRDVSQSVGAMEGTLGKDVSPSMRKFNSWMTVYQNIRLLPMALFSSFVDPLALVARGAPMQAAYETFVYGMREVFRNWADAFKDMPPERVKDEWRQLAEHIGASEIAMFQHHVSDEYSSTYMTPGAKKINDKMFTFNGMEAWNRGSRIMATKWAVRFIEQHAGLPDKNHSARWLKELGLTPAMITMDGDKLVTSPQQLAVLKGITLDEARAQIAPIHDALNRWVEGAVLTPNAAQRPAWSSDPNYATAFHLKQFSYSFHQTILKRATNEFGHGNMAPLAALALFIPTMIGADLMKGLIQGGGSLPPYMAGMNAGDWVMHGAQRAGLSGIGVIGMDAATDWASLGGPAFEQIVDAARDGFGSKTVLNAAPLHSLYGQLVT